MVKYRIYELDVWGNEIDGFYINDIFKTSRVIELLDNFDDDELIKALEGWYEFSVIVELDDYSIEGVIYINNEETSEPLLKLEKEI